jgi:predicted ATPase/class 3 adenylate cyclase
VTPGEVAWFVFTDLQDSTRLWDDDPTAMEAALATHDARLRDTLGAPGGRIVKHTGDGMLAVFDDAHDAVRAAVAAQRSLATAEWTTREPLQIRVAIHGGVSDDPAGGWYRRGDDFVGPELNRCARLMAAAQGGQTLCSSAVADAVAQNLDLGFELVDVGTHALRGLSRPERVFDIRDPTLPATVRPLSPTSTPNNLPTSPDEFIGREREVEAVVALVRRHRLVTLTGVGGVGKTRLALQVAETLVEEFPDGVYFVSLAPLSEPELIESTVAQALGVRERPGVSLLDGIIEAVAQRRILVVLDNCEHLIDAAAQIASAVVGAGAGPRVLATSRETLDVAGEHGWSVPVLDVPFPGASLSEAAAASAVRLLVDRAIAARPDFELGERNLDDVIELCRRLDGIPLALELACGRLDAMTPREIIERLDRRFRLLGRTRAREGRHGTLREAIDWSHELLTVEERVLFRRLAVFAGGFDVASAEAVTSGGIVEDFEVADVLTRLVRKSMVVVTQSGRSSRFRLLETLRQYAREQLADEGESDIFADAHAVHYVRVVESLAHDIRSPGQATAYDVLWRELDNLRAAFDRLIQRADADRALRMIRITRTFWTEFMPAEGFQRALAAVAVGETASAALLAGGLADASWIARVMGRDDAAAYARSSLETSGAAGITSDPEALLTMALEELFAGDTGAALRYFEQARDDALQLGDRYEYASAVVGVCIVRAIEGNTEDAVRDGEEAVRVGRELGYDTQLAGGLAALGFAYGAIDPNRAVELLEESFAIKPDTTYSLVARMVAGHLYVLLGNPRAAFTHFRESLRSYIETGDVMFVPTSLEGVAGALCLIGQADDAARLLHAASVAREKLDIRGIGPERDLRSFIEALVAAAGADTAAAQNAADRLTLDDHVVRAIAIAEAGAHT